MNNSDDSGRGGFGLAFREAAASALVLAGCAAALHSAPADAAGMTVNVGTEPAFAPFEYTDEKTKEFVGFDMDIIKAVGKAGGFEVKISSLPFDGIIPAVLTGTIDAAISAITITEERAKKVDFTEPYYDAGLGILINNKVKDSVKSQEDLKGRTICVQIATSGAMLASKIEGARVTQFNSAPETYIELGKGGCDAVINDFPVHAYYMATAKPGNITLLPGMITSEQYGIMMSKSKPKVQEAIRAGLAKIKSGGTYDAIYRKWFGDARQ